LHIVAILSTPSNLFLSRIQRFEFGVEDTGLT
jgi:hypothetical protein